MSYSQHDFYSDDPIEGTSSPVKKKFPGFVAFLLFIFAGGSFLQTTLAANISLNPGAPVEFGQGITQTAACSGASNLTITPNSTFTNVSGGGAHYFSSVTVSNVPISCYGDDFTIKAFNNSSSSPLAIFNSTSTNAVVWNDGGTFKLGTGSSGMAIAQSAGTFTVTFTSPVALSSTVFKLTVESGAHTEVYGVGLPGPGGGTVFYYSEAGFNCGPTHSATGSPTGGLCNYLEVAPSGWNTGSDPTRYWANASDYNYRVTGVTVQNSGWNTSAGVGLGYKDSVAIVTNGRGIDSTTAAGLARAYLGGSMNDWYLGSPVELNLLCQWARGVASSVTTSCTGGTLNSVTFGASAAGLLGVDYWSSTQDTVNHYAVTTHFNTGSTTRIKNTLNYVRPIRAF
jgi:hypothetical protein